MSHTRDDRIADQDPRQCSAYGCPMPGSMSSSTNGASEWQCWMHFGQPMGRWQQITADLNRMQWLVTTLVKLRRDYGSRLWPDTYREAVQAIKAAQRSDLLIAKDERPSQWFMRLDAALREACAPEPAPNRQKPVVCEQPADTFSKVGFELPV